MIKAAIKSVVSHLTIVHVLRGSGCVGDRVTTGFAQQGYWSCYYFQLWKQSEICRPAFIEQKKNNSPGSPICVFYLVLIVLSAAPELIMVLYYFLPSFRVSSLSRNLGFSFQFTLTNYSPKQIQNNLYSYSKDTFSFLNTN